MTKTTRTETAAPDDEGVDGHDGRLPRARLPQQPFTKPVAERREMGRARREQWSRRALADWKAPADRRDPVDLILGSEAGRLESLLPLRHQRMLASAFAFYRGTAIIHASDLGSAPSTGLDVWACGDAHLMNFGGFASPERTMVFDINDFDEASVAPFDWDLKRLAASFVLAGRDRGFAADVGKDAARSAVRTYRERMAEYSTMRILDVWYERIDLVDLISRGTDKEMRRFNLKMVEAARNRSAKDVDFAKLAVVEGERPRIKDAPPLIFHPTEWEDEAFQKIAETSLADYRASLPPERRPLVNRYEYKDAALKVVGVGSVGSMCGVLLMMSGNGDPLFLQFKEAGPSVLEAFAGASVFKHSGQRVVVGQRLMQAASDIFLGWFTGTGPGKRQFYMRQLRDAKVSANVEIMQPVNLTAYAKACGMALARAHARSADPALLSGYMGKSEVFDDALTSYAVAYADQAETDYEAFRAAARSGRVSLPPEA